MGAFRFDVRREREEQGMWKEIDRAGQHILVISALRGQSQEGHEFKTSLSYRMRSIKKLWRRIENKGKRKRGREKEKDRRTDS